MAFMHKVVTQSGRNVSSYNFDKPVTTFGGGSKYDVMLLQALFRIVYYELQPGGLPLPPTSTGIIKVDGKMGPQTRIHIQHWQKMLARGSPDPRGLDGVMDPYPAVARLTKNTHRKYQLDVLNATCDTNSDNLGKPEVYQRMVDVEMHGDDIYPDPGFRAALRIARKFP